METITSAYALLLKDEDTGEFELWSDEMNIQDGKNSLVRFLKIFEDKTEAYKYINGFGYEDEQVDLIEVGIVRSK